MSKLSSLFAGLLMISSFACTDNVENFNAIYGDFTIPVDRLSVSFDGVIDEGALADLEEALEDYTTIKTLNIVKASGNASSNAAFEMGRLLKDKNVNSSIVENGKVEKNGLYFFLGGQNRSIESGAQLGVSSWTTSSSEEASSLPMDNSAHTPYLDYLMDIGFTEEKAKSFYFFAIESAASNDTYWMSDSEISQFGLVN